MVGDWHESDYDYTWPGDYPTYPWPTEPWFPYTIPPSIPPVTYWYTCPECGASISTHNSYNFCPYCGHPLFGGVKDPIEDKLIRIEELLKEIKGRV